ncbi:Uncharacterised protein [Yersinia pekkanenii]|uniref:Uncharacterized protein n=1 Tax=Yersinia pekkanenii TaxID=1288385 RepID=A0A0T9Q8T2_9GAMM|nr:Uncharacterised protein [Yersinia pekkanenii]CRY63576.1 Uncharacterised protein [Yersinia pekkanenii]
MSSNQNKPPMHYAQYWHLQLTKKKHKQQNEAMRILFTQNMYGLNTCIT